MTPDIWMILAFAGLLIAGVPVAFSLALSGAVGIVLGLAAGILSVAALADGIDLSAFAEGIDAFGMSVLLIPVLNTKDLVMFSSLSLLLGLVASIFPALRAVRITPLMAMNR